MHVTQVSVRRTIQVRPYTPESVEVTVAVNPGEDVGAAIAEARAIAYAELGIQFGVEHDYRPSAIPLTK